MAHHSSALRCLRVTSAFCWCLQSIPDEMVDRLADV
jgi:hypothetical protein